MNAKGKKALAELRGMGVTMTRAPRLSDAALCRSKGWVVGDVLEGDEGYGPTRIRITAIGERDILARAISHDGKPLSASEGPWTLAHRDWRKVERTAGLASEVPK